MSIIKLSGRKAVVSENGVSKVVTAPCGVSYSDVTDRWGTWILDEDFNWKSKSFSVKKHGALNAFELAVAEREESLTFLLNRRMLPRIKRLMPGFKEEFVYREENGLFVVRDPLTKTNRKFTTKAAAEAFNRLVTKQWIEEYTFSKLEMYESYSAYLAREKAERSMTTTRVPRAYDNALPAQHGTLH